MKEIYRMGVNIERERDREWERERQRMRERDREWESEKDNDWVIVISTDLQRKTEYEWIVDNCVFIF